MHTIVASLHPSPILLLLPPPTSPQTSSAFAKHLEDENGKSWKVLIMISEYLNYSCFSTTHVDLETSAPSKPWYTLKLFGNWKPSGGISACQCKRCGFDPWVWSLGWKDPLEEEMATYSSILAWRIPWTGDPGRLQSMELQRVWYDWAINTFNTYCIVDIVLITVLVLFV